MFTGLVEGLGTVRQVVAVAPGCKLEIDLGPLADGVALGDSIAINGCCLTVVAVDGSACTFEAGPETLSRTNLGRLKVDSPVNLERSLRVGDRLGGHFVTGHVDTAGALEEKSETGDWVTLWFTIASTWQKHLAAKGSIAIDGVSLTVVAVEPTRFSVALIPHTLAQTTLGRLTIGDVVNLETDLLAKYVERQLSGGHAHEADSSTTAAVEEAADLPTTEPEPTATAADAPEPPAPPKAASTQIKSKPASELPLP